MSTHHIETHTKTKTSSPQQHRPRNRSPAPAAHHPAVIIQRAQAAPESLSAADVMQLQRTIGNQAVGRLLAEISQGKRQPTGIRGAQYPIQPKLTINPPGDIYEQEADRVAKQVVDQISQPVSQGQSQPVQQKDQCEGEECVQTKPDMQLQVMPEEEELLQGKMTETIQSQPGPEEEEELLQGTFTETVQRQEPEEEELMLKPLVQRQAEGRMAATRYLEDPIKQARGSGQILADNTRASMEQAFGADFSGVRVHMGAQSDQLSRLIQARAFTTGQDIFFRQGEYNPSTRAGQELLSHELTHVVQQNRSAIQREPGEKGATGRSRPEITTPSIEQESTNKTVHRKMVDAWVGVEVLPVFSIDNYNVTHKMVDSLDLNHEVKADDVSSKIGDTKYTDIKYTKATEDKVGTVNFDKLRFKGPKERTGALDVVKGGAEIYGDVTDVYDLRAGSIDRGKELRVLEEGYKKDKGGSTETKEWQQKHGAEVVSGVSETLGSIMSLANTIRKWRSRKRKQSKIIGDSFDVAATTASTGAAVPKIIDSSSKLDKDTRGGTGSDVRVTSPTTKAQSYTTTVSDFASKVGGNIADFAGLLKDVKDIFFTFKKAWITWRKKSSSKGDIVRASFVAGKTFLNTVKDAVATVRNLLFTLTNAHHAGLSTAVPGLGIAINALKLCMNVYEVIKAGKRKTLMTHIMKDIKKDKNYKLAKDLWKINVKRMKRQAINITNGFLKISGDIATLSGAGAIVGVAFKGSASAIELGAKGLRTIKQFGRNRATKKGAWKITTKVFNVEKSTSEKRKKYNLLAEQIYNNIEELAKTPQIEKMLKDNDWKKKLNGLKNEFESKLKNYIRAAGLSWKSWSKQMQADPDKGHEMLIKSLKRRE